MSIKEQLEIKNKYYHEALRYMSNAKEILQKSGKEEKHYQDDKYVKIACGTAYNAVLKALDGYLYLRGIEKKKGRKSIEYYQTNLSKIDKSLNRDLHSVYEVLHLSGYYDGVTYVPTVKSGFDLAYSMIEKIKP